MKNKSMWIIRILLYDFIFSLLANSMGLTVVGDTIQDTPTQVNIVTGLFDTMQLFINMLIFNVEGLNDIITIIFIWFPNLTLLLIIISFIFNRD